MPDFVLRMLVHEMALGPQYLAPGDLPLCAGPVSLHLPDLETYCDLARVRFFGAVIAFHGILPGLKVLHMQRTSTGGSLL